MKYIGCLGHIQLAYVALGISQFQRLVILNQADSRTTDFLRRIGTEVIHHRLDFLGTTLTGFHHVHGGFLRESIFYIDFHQYVIECLALVFGPSTDFGQQRAGRNRVFITDKVFGQEAIAFFTTTDILLLTFTQTDFAGNPLEAGVAVAHFNLVLVCHSLDEFGGHDGLHDEVVRLHLTHCNTVLDDVVQEDETSLVTIDKHPLALIVLAGHTDTVGIRVTCHHDVNVNLLSQRNGHGKGFGIFGIRRNHCREIAVLHHLFGHAVDILKSPLLQ